MEMIRTLDAIAKIPTPYRVTPAVARYFNSPGVTRQDARGEVLRSLTKAVDPKRIEEVLPPGYRSLLHDTIAITEIHGGVCPNCMPMKATADVDIRVLDDEKTDPILGKVKELMPNGGEVEVLLAEEPSPESPSDTDLFRLL